MQISAIKYIIIIIINFNLVPLQIEVEDLLLLVRMDINKMKSFTSFTL